MEYYVLQSALDNFNELQKKVSSEMKDWDEYVNKKFNTSYSPITLFPYSLFITIIYYLLPS